MMTMPSALSARIRKVMGLKLSVFAAAVLSTSSLPSFQAGKGASSKIGSSASTWSYCRNIGRDIRWARSYSTETESRMKQDAIEICKKAIAAVDPCEAVKKAFQLEDGNLVVGSERVSLADYDSLVLVAFGKASSAMASTILEILSEHGEEKSIPNIQGIVICKDHHATDDEIHLLQEGHGIRVRYASHPVPDDRSVSAACEVLEMVQKQASPSTLVLCCISGGGSALFCAPQPPLELEDLRFTNKALLASGLDIQSMNVIRKRLELGKGGRLAAAAYPSRVIAMVLSDVLGDPLDLIASGPTVPDTSTWEDARAIVQQTSWRVELPSSVIAFLNKRPREAGDSPSPEHPTFSNTSTVLVGNNDLAVSAAAKYAGKLGYEPVVLGSQIEGEAKDVAQMYVAMALYLQQQHSIDSEEASFAMVDSLPAAIISGGETTVSLSESPGMGGRNQELALSAALKLNKLDLGHVVLASVGTDGTDGPTDAAGAVVHRSTIENNVADAKRALANHNAYPYLDGLGSLIRTGPTGTNVADVCVTLVGARK